MVDYTASGSDIGGTGAVFLVNLSTVPDDVLVSSGVLVNSGGTIIDQIEGGFTKTVILNTNTISIDHISLGDPAETFTGKISQN